MRFREARIEDLEELVRLHACMDAEEKVLGCVVMHPATREFIRQKLLDPQTRFLIVEDRSQIVAFAYGTLDGVVFELQNVFVVPTWRRNGVAREMLTRLFSETPATQRCRGVFSCLNLLRASFERSDHAIEAPRPPHAGFQHSSRAKTYAGKGSERRRLLGPRETST